MDFPVVLLLPCQTECAILPFVPYQVATVDLEVGELAREVDGHIDTRQRGVRTVFVPGDSLDGTLAELPRLLIELLGGRQPVIEGERLGNKRPHLLIVAGIL